MRETTNVNIGPDFYNYVQQRPYWRKFNRLVAHRFRLGAYFFEESHMTLSRFKKILIAGAGLGGLAAALSLLKRGIDVEVFEQSKELREVGAGLHISPNAFRVLDELGIGQEVMEKSCVAAGREVRLWSSGETWPIFDLGIKSVERYGFPYLTVYRPDLLNALVSAVRAIKPDAIHLQSACQRFEQNGHGVTLYHTLGQAQGHALIGGDGVHSKIREELCGDDAPQYSGLLAWRGLIPMERLPERMRRLVGTNWIGPGGHIVHYPVRKGALMNFAGITESEGQWLTESWNVQGSVEECLACYPDWNEDLHLMIKAIKTPYKWALMIRPPLDTWTIERVTLLGDASHATLPFLAQGAAMALEDGFILARAISEMDDIPSALKRYENVRKERCNRVVMGSAANAKRFHNPLLADPVEARAYVNRELSPEKIAERYEWVYTYDVNAVQL